MRLLAVLAVALGLGLLPLGAEAQLRGRALTSLDALHAACRGAERDGPRRLYSMVVEPSGYAFAPYDADEGVLWVDTRRSLQGLDGAVQLLPTGLEPLGFTTTLERANLLRSARMRGAKLRVGFFLGFDGRSGTLCLIRPAAGVTTARIDVAYVELLDTDGAVLAREDSERLRAFLDDPERQRVPGEGPRGALGEATVVRGARALPDVWRAALASPPAPLREALTRCYTEALARGAARDGQVLVRLNVDGATGSIASAEVELATLGDAEGATCVARALERGITLAPAGLVGAVEVRVPVRLVAD